MKRFTKKALISSKEWRSPDSLKRLGRKRKKFYRLYQQQGMATQATDVAAQRITAHTVTEYQRNQQPQHQCHLQTSGWRIYQGFPSPRPQLLSWPMGPTLSWLSDILPLESTSPLWRGGCYSLEPCEVELRVEIRGPSKIHTPLEKTSPKRPRYWRN